MRTGLLGGEGGIDTRRQKVALAAAGVVYQLSRRREVMHEGRLRRSQLSQLTAFGDSPIHWTETQTIAHSVGSRSAFLQSGHSNTSKPRV